MSQQDHTRINELQIHRPLCSKCGGPTTLARIEPAPEPGHDLRTFECTACDNADVVTVKFK